MKHILVLLIFFATTSAYAQKLYTRNDSIPITQDSVTLKAGPYRGNIQWQKSLDNKNWLNLEGKITDSLKVKPDTEAMYRAKVAEGTCLPIYSDTASLIFVKPDIETLPASSILSTSVVLNGKIVSMGGIEVSEKGFYISEVIDSITHGIKVVSSKNDLNFDTTYDYLKPETNYYACAYAINDKGQSLGSPITFKTNEFKIAIVNIKEETDWDYMVIDKDGNYYYLKEINSKPSAFYLKLTGSQNAMTVFFNESGFPEKVVFDDYIFLLGNYNVNNVDIVCISPTGETEIVRNIETQVNWDQSSLKIANNIAAWSDVIRWTGRVVGAIPCAAAIAATGLTFGAGLLVAAVPCGIYILKTSADIREEEFGITDGYTELGKIAGGLGALSNIIGNCQGLVDPASCLIGLGAGALDKWADELEKIENSRIADLTNGKVLLVTGFYVKTSPVTSITGKSALVGGTIIVDQDAIINDRGVYFGTSPNPELTGTKVQIGSEKTTFSGSLTELNPNTVYYVKAFASNGIRTAYGEQVSFTTGQAITPPILTTNPITDITQTSATSGGNITSDGGAAVTASGICWSTSQDPTTATNFTTDGNASSFTSNLSGLTANTTYYVWAYATNSAGTGYGNQVSFTTVASAETGTVTDIDGNVYHTVTIGTQVWMVENLKTTRCNDGSAIELETDRYHWPFLYSPGYCWYDNDEVNNKNTYGALYNWDAVNTGKLAPVGWHVPSDYEWTTLINYLGGENYAGGKLKETGLNHWDSPNTGATNSTGFTALPGGARTTTSSYNSIGETGYWWSSTEIPNSALSAYAWIMYDFSSSARRNINYEFSDGLSVRCMKDN